MYCSLLLNALIVVFSVLDNSKNTGIVPGLIQISIVAICPVINKSLISYFALEVKKQIWHDVTGICESGAMKIKWRVISSNNPLIQFWKELIGQWGESGRCLYMQRQTRGGEVRVPASAHGPADSLNTRCATAASRDHRKTHIHTN